jgi:hypothetical protein
MREQRKIRSVLELARYKVGDVAWWVVLRPQRDIPTLTEDQQWMVQPDVHPKILYRNGGPYSHLWGKAVLPKLQHMDFAAVMGLLTHEFSVEQFPICDVIRSRNLGEFFYTNDSGDWMPESHLMDTKVAADREKTRVLRLIKKWAEDLR